MGDSTLLSISSGRSTVHYDPLTGIFYRQYIGAEIKKISQVTATYQTVSVNNKTYPAHRLAWFMFYGKWPDQVIDHINGNPADNRITNLRDVSPKVNSQNRKSSDTELIKLIQLLIERRKQRKK